MTENELRAKVRAVNAAHAEANRLHPLLTGIFAPLVGQEILKVDSNLLLKYERLLPAMPNTHDLHVYGHTHSYSLRWTVKACQNVEDAHHCLYYEVSVYIGDIRGKVLTGLTAFQPFRADYTPEKIRRQQQLAAERKRAYEEAKSQLWPFGER